MIKNKLGYQCWRVTSRRKKGENSVSKNAKWLQYYFFPSILIYFPRVDKKYYMEIVFITVKTIRPISLKKKRDFKVCGRTFR